MPHERTAYRLRCWLDQREDVVHLELVRVETEEDVRLGDKYTFLIRVRLQGESQAEPAYQVTVVHGESGAAAHLRAGAGLGRFAEACLPDGWRPGDDAGLEGEDSAEDV